MPKKATATAAPVPPRKMFACDACKVEKQGKRAKGDALGPPPGWKRVAERLLCQDCCKSAYAIAAIRVRILRPVNATWPELRAALQYAWRETTRIANWSIRTLLAQEPPLIHGSDKPPARLKQPDLYALYKHMRGTFPSYAALATITRAKAIFKRDAFKVATGQASAPSMRYPQPFCITAPKNLGSIVEIDGEKKVTIAVVLPVSPTETREFILQLKGGYRSRRPIAAMQRMIDGEVFRATLRERQIPGGLPTSRRTPSTRLGYLDLRQRPRQRQSDSDAVVGDPGTKAVAPAEPPTTSV